MSAPKSELDRQEIAAAFGVDVAADLEGHPDWEAAIHEGLQETDGAVYKYVEILYSEAGDVTASRNVAVILPGNRTELAYWARSAGEQTLTVHKGSGLLVVMKPGGSLVDQALLTEDRDVTLQPESFYAILAAENDSEPLVVSGYYEPPPDWETLEVAFPPGTERIDTPDGEVAVPPAFHRYCQSPVGRP